MRAMNWGYCLLCSRSTAAQGEADDEAEEDGGWEGVGMRCRAVGFKRVSLRDACASRSCLKDRGNAELGAAAAAAGTGRRRLLALLLSKKFFFFASWSHVKYVTCDR
jgi:hypothetical protein